MRCLDRLILIFTIAGGCMLAVPNIAHGSPETRKAAILTTMTEAALAATSVIHELEPGELQELSWYADYSERDWVFSSSGFIGDRKFTFTISGLLWG